MIVVGIDLCVYPKNATKYYLSRNQGRHIGLPLRRYISTKSQTVKKQKRIVVGIDLCVYPENATKQSLFRNQGRHTGLPLRYKLFQKYQKPFINLVDQILEKKKDNPEVDTGEIDWMVSGLYRLEEEIGVIEIVDNFDI